MSDFLTGNDASSNSELGVLVRWRQKNIWFCVLNAMFCPSLRWLSIVKAETPFVYYVCWVQAPKKIAYCQLLFLNRITVLRAMPPALSHFVRWFEEFLDGFW